MNVTYTRVNDKENFAKGYEIEEARFRLLIVDVRLTAHITNIFIWDWLKSLVLTAKFIH